jgi:hypothetical protein
VKDVRAHFGPAIADRMSPDVRGAVVKYENQNASDRKGMKMPKSDSVLLAALVVTELYQNIRKIVREELDRAVYKFAEEQVDVYPLSDEKVEPNDGSKADTAKEGRCHDN